MDALPACLLAQACSVRKAIYPYPEGGTEPTLSSACCCPTADLAGGVDDDGVVMMAGTCIDLESLDLSGSVNIRRGATVAILCSRCTRLRRLNLYGCGGAGAGAAGPTEGAGGEKKKKKKRSRGAGEEDKKEDEDEEFGFDVSFLKQIVISTELAPFRLKART